MRGILGDNAFMEGSFLSGATGISQCQRSRVLTKPFSGTRATRGAVTPSSGSRVETVARWPRR